MGIAPVTKQSGRSRTVSMRYACNGRLRDVAYHWARVGAQRDPKSRTYYTSLRARGHSHGRALRSVADRFLRLLFTLLEMDTCSIRHMANARFSRGLTKGGKSIPTRRGGTPGSLF